MPTLFDLLSCRRAAQVSEPITEKATWETFAKFYIHPMAAKIPTASVSTTKHYDATPGFLAVSMGKPPYIAMTLGDKVVTIMDYSGVYQEEGFFIPLDYGHIVKMVWVNHEVLVIGLANGYVVLVSAPLLMRQRKNSAAHVAGREQSEEIPVTSKSMSTTRVFQNYLSDCIELEGSPAVLGDNSVKVRLDQTRSDQPAAAMDDRIVGRGVWASSSPSPRSIPHPPCRCCVSTWLSGGRTSAFPSQRTLRSTVSSPASTGISKDGVG